MSKFKDLFEDGCVLCGESFRGPTDAYQGHEFGLEFTGLAHRDCGWDARDHADAGEDAAKRAARG